MHGQCQISVTKPPPQGPAWSRLLAGVTSQWVLTMITTFVSADPVSASTMSCLMLLKAQCLCLWPNVYHQCLRLVPSIGPNNDNNIVGAATISVIQDVNFRKRILIYHLL